MAWTSLAFRQSKAIWHSSVQSNGTPFHVRFVRGSATCEKEDMRIRWHAPRKLFTPVTFDGTGNLEMASIFLGSMEISSSANPLGFPCVSSNLTGIAICCVWNQIMILHPIGAFVRNQSSLIHTGISLSSAVHDNIKNKKTIPSTGNDGRAPLNRQVSHRQPGYYYK